MKRILSTLTFIALLLGLAACGTTPPAGTALPADGSAPPAISESKESLQPAGEPGESSGEDDTIHVLVAYFSATGNTRPLAQAISDSLGADLCEIVPEVPYTEADLDYNTDCRANREQNDDAARPVISGGVEDMAQYDVVFLGYPIWWGKAPKIIHTFLESYDFTGKTIVPFCTSASSGYNDSTITPLAESAQWVTGSRFSAGTSQDALVEWVNSLGLDLTAE